MTPPRSHTRPPNKFRGTSLIVAAIVTTVVVALGVGTASASVRGKGGHRGFGFGNAQQQNRAGQGRQGQQGQQGQGNQGQGNQTTAPAATDSAAATATSTDSAAATDSASATATGPVADDFVNINQVQPKNNQAQTGQNGSTGTLNETCDLSGHQNSDNVIAAAGVTNGAHHLHDYVGNKDTSGASTNDSLAAAGTTCTNGDQSAFFWPVVRDLTKGTNPQNRVAGELDADLNVGLALLPKITLQFQGNPNSKVTAMPEFLRVLAGDAKASVNGGANQHAQFTCQGFTNRISTTQYTLCPGGKGFTRIHEFPSCWDGQNIDSANHRTHIVYPDPQTQQCPAANPVVVPKLVTTLVYNVPAGANFAVDSFPESLHKPIDDHDDFINVASNQLETQIVDCINTGKKC